MQSKPVLIGFASAILVLVVAAASFSAGLYLGQRGYVANLQYVPQMENAPQFAVPYNSVPYPSQPQAGYPGPGGSNSRSEPPNAPSWPPDSLGRLLSLSAAEIVLDTPQGQVAIAINSSTKFINEAGVEISSFELKPGDVVAVFGKETASTVMRLPAPPSP